MKVTKMIAKVFHKNGRIERSVTFFDGTKMIGAVGSSIKAEEKAEPVMVQPIIEKVEYKVPDSYLEPLIRIGVVKTH